MGKYDHVEIEKKKSRAVIEAINEKYSRKVEEMKEIIRKSTSSVDADFATSMELVRKIEEEWKAELDKVNGNEISNEYTEVSFNDALSSITEDKDEFTFSEEVANAVEAVRNDTDELPVPTPLDISTDVPVKKVKTKHGKPRFDLTISTRCSDRWEKQIKRLAKSIKFRNLRELMEKVIVPEQKNISDTLIVSLFFLALDYYQMSLTYSNVDPTNEAHVSLYDHVMEFIDRYAVKNDASHLDLIEAGIIEYHGNFETTTLTQEFITYVSNKTNQFNFTGSDVNSKYVSNVFLGLIEYMYLYQFPEFVIDVLSTIENGDRRTVNGEKKILSSACRSITCHLASVKDRKPVTLSVLSNMLGNVIDGNIVATAVKLLVNSKILGISKLTRSGNESYYLSVPFNEHGVHRG